MRNLAWIFAILLGVALVLRLTLDRETYFRIEGFLIAVRAISIIGLVVTYIFRNAKFRR
jgi:hypothetical protein